VYSPSYKGQTSGGVLLYLEDVADLRAFHIDAAGQEVRPNLPAREPIPRLLRPATVERTADARRSGGYFLEIRRGRRGSAVLTSR